jgi:hypothetical protein
MGVACIDKRFVFIRSHKHLFAKILTKVQYIDIYLYIYKLTGIFKKRRPRAIYQKSTTSDTKIWHRFRRLKRRQFS